MRRARGEQPLGDGLQGLQPQLAVLLALDQHPLVVPVGQKLGAEQLPVRIEPAAGVVDGAVQVVVAERLRPSEIDVDRRMQRDVPVPASTSCRPGRCRRQTADRRLATARRSGESSQSIPATWSRRVGRGRRARNVSRRRADIGNVIGVPSQRSSNPPNSRNSTAGRPDLRVAGSNRP